MDHVHTPKQGTTAADHACLILIMTGFVINGNRLAVKMKMPATSSRLLPKRVIVIILNLATIVMAHAILTSTRMVYAIKMNYLVARMMKR